MPSRARLIAIAALAVAFCACLGALAATIGSAIQLSVRVPAAQTPYAIAPTTAGNELAAQADVQRLLANLVLPNGATPSATEPSGDSGLLAPMQGLSVTFARADLHAWFVVAGDPGAILSFVQAHKPAGSALSGSGSGEIGTGATSQTVSFSWPAISGVLGERQLWVTATALPDGQTGVLAQAESVWIVTRPASETIPPGVHEVDLTTTGPGRRAGTTRTILTRHVTSAATARRIVALIDGLQVAQPEVIACPALLVSSHVTLRFRTHAGGAILARASFFDEGPASINGQCDSISFSSGGSPQTPLVGNVIAPLQTLLGVDLATGKRLHR